MLILEGPHYDSGKRHREDHIHGDEPARATGKFWKVLHPEHVEGAARAAFTWLKPTSRFWDSGPAFREFPTSPATLGRLGSLEVRLAQNKRDIKRAQKLRFHVFYENGTAVADAITMLARRDRHGFDAIFDRRVNVSQERYDSRKFAPLLWESSRGPTPLRLQGRCAQRLLLPRREHYGSLSCQQPEREGLLQVQFDDRPGMAQITDRDILPDV